MQNGNRIAFERQGGHFGVKRINSGGSFS